MAFSSEDKKEQSKEKESKWISVQVKGLTAYLNSYLARVGITIDSDKLTAGLKDGVALCKFCEIVAGKKLRFDTTPSMKIQRIQNLASAISFMKADEPDGLGIRILGIGAEDIENEYLKLVLGLIYSAFRKLRLGRLAEELGKKEGARSSEAKLMLEWVQKMTEGYTGVEVTDFKTSFTDGLAFCALVNRFNTEYCDFDSLSAENAEENLELAFAAAADKIGVPRLLEISDVASGAPDERSMVLYTSLMYHAFRQQEEIGKISDARKSLKDQLEELKVDKEALLAEGAAKDSKIAELEAKIEELEAEIEKLKEGNKSIAGDLEARTAEIEKLKLELDETKSALELKGSSNSDLEAEIARLKKLLADEEALRKAFQEEAVTRDEAFENMGSYFEEDFAGLRSKLEGESLDDGESRAKEGLEGESLEAGEELEGESLGEGESRETMDDEGGDAEEKGDGEGAEKRSRKLRGVTRERKALMRKPLTRAQLKKETQDLNKKLLSEVKRNQARAKELQRLLDQNKKLQEKIIAQQKAHSGLAVLRRNLEEHLEDLYRWRDLYKLDLDPTNATKLKFDLGDVTTNMAGKKFDEQIDFLTDKLSEENRNLLRIINVKNSKLEVADSITKKGFLYTKLERKKEFNKGYFVLRNYVLMYYANDQAEIHDFEGSTRLDQPCELTLLKTDKSADGSKVYPIRINIVGEGEGKKNQRLYIATLSKRDRRNWLATLTGKAVQFNYLKDVEEAGRRPDTRILSLLEQENISSVYLNDKPIPKEGIAAVTRILSCYDAINEVSISNASLNTKSFKILGTTLGRMHIKVLNLSHNPIDDEGATSISESLATSQKIEEVDLSHGDIGDKGAEALATVLSTNKKLSAFLLAHNSIGDAGATAIVEAMSDEHPITSLDLSHNKIGDGAAAAIAALISKSTKINSIDLSANRFTDEGMKLIIDALVTNEVITSVNLSANDLSNVSALAVAELLSKNKFLVSVNLSGNPKISGDPKLSGLFTNSAFFLPSIVLSRAQFETVAEGSEDDAGKSEEAA